MSPVTESLRERCIRGMAVNDHPDLLKVAEHHLDRLLNVLEESAREEYNDHGAIDLCIEGSPFVCDLFPVLRGNGE